MNTTDESSTVSELNRYVAELSAQSGKCSGYANPLTFWKERKTSFPKLALLAEDLLSAPASQAYVERIFSVCGMLTAGRRNRLTKALENRAFLKLNSHILNYGK